MGNRVTNDLPILCWSGLAGFVIRVTKGSNVTRSQKPADPLLERIGALVVTLLPIFFLLRTQEIFSKLFEAVRLSDFGRSNPLCRQSDIDRFEPVAAHNPA